MVTLIDLERSQEQQDKGIRLEFKNVHRRLDDQRTYMDGRFDEMDRRFERIDEKFDEQRAYMDKRFERIDERFEKMDERSAKMEDRADKFDEQFHELKAMVLNAHATGAWNDIQPVGLFDPLAQPGSRYIMPTYFPNKIAKFWHLKRPRNHHRLIYLIRFYNLQGLENWKQDLLENSDNESDLDEPSQHPSSLEEMVRADPDLALAALAARLGLDYGKISRSMDVVETLQQVKAEKEKRASKREQISSSEEKQENALRPAKKLVGRASVSRPEQEALPVDQPRHVFTIGGVPARSFHSDDGYLRYHSPSPEQLSYVYWKNSSLSPRPKVRDLSDAIYFPDLSEESKDGKTRAQDKEARAPSQQSVVSEESKDGKPRAQDKEASAPSQQSVVSTKAWTHTPSPFKKVNRAHPRQPKSPENSE